MERKELKNIIDFLKGAQLLQLASTFEKIKDGLDDKFSVHEYFCDNGWNYNAVKDEIYVNYYSCKTNDEKKFCVTEYENFLNEFLKYIKLFGDSRPLQCNYDFTLHNIKEYFPVRHKYFDEAHFNALKNINGDTIEINKPFAMVADAAVTNKLTKPIIALICCYNGILVTRSNAAEIARKFGHERAGRLYQEYTKAMIGADRLATEHLKTKKLQRNRKELFEMVISHLEGKQKQKAQDELNLILSKIENSNML